MSSSASSHFPKKLIPSLFAILVVIFALGIVGHLEVGNSKADSVFKALQLFHLHYHPFPETAQAGENETVPLTIEIARFAGALWGLALLPLLVGFLFEERVQRWRVRRFWKGHYVVCGQGQGTLALVRDLRKKKQRVVLVGHCAGMKEILPSGVLLLVGDSADGELLKKAAVHRAAYLIAFHQEDHANIETLVTAGNLCAKWRPKRQQNGEPLNAFAQIADPCLAQTLQQLCQSGKNLAGECVRANFFNYYELIARLLVRQFPLPGTVAARSRPAPEHFVLIGFGAFGQNVALKLVRMTQQLFLDSDNGVTQWKVAKPKITIVDPNAQSLLAEFERFHPQFRDFCELDQFSISTADPRFLDLPFLANQSPGGSSSLFFCVETEPVILRAISLLGASSDSEKCPISRIYLRIAQPERLGAFLEQLQSGKGKAEIKVIAPDRELFTADVILNQKLDLLAKEIHKAWLSVESKDRRKENTPTATGKTWEQLSDADRLANREAADHLWAKLHALGFKLKEAENGLPAPKADEALLRQLRELEEELARSEHFRWMTWRVLNGWRYGTPRNDHEKIHPDIVDYDQLQESTKEKDRVNIRIIPRLLQEGHLKAAPERERA